jgi:hypothetical protein
MFDGSPHSFSIENTLDGGSDLTRASFLNDLSVSLALLTFAIFGELRFDHRFVMTLNFKIANASECHLAQLYQQTTQGHGGRSRFPFQWPRLIASTKIPPFAIQIGQLRRGP